LLFHLFGVVDIYLINVDDKHKDVEAMHDASKNVMLKRVLLPLEVDQLLD